MPSLVITDSVFTYEFVSSGELTSMPAVGKSLLLTHFGELNDLVPVKELKFTLVSGVHYTYKIELMDGREWHQNIYVTGNSFNTSEVTFNVTDPFTFPVLEKLIAMRRGLDYLVRADSITKIEFNRIP